MSTVTHGHVSRSLIFFHFGDTLCGAYLHPCSGLTRCLWLHFTEKVNPSLHLTDVTCSDSEQERHMVSSRLGGNEALVTMRQRETDRE